MPEYFVQFQTIIYHLSGSNNTGSNIFVRCAIAAFPRQRSTPLPPPLYPAPLSHAAASAFRWSIIRCVMPSYITFIFILPVASY